MMSTHFFTMQRSAHMDGLSLSFCLSSARAYVSSPALRRESCCCRLPKLLHCHSWQPCASHLDFPFLPILSL